jgi:hypothetical protein
MIAVTFTITQKYDEWEKVRARLRPILKGPRAKVGAVGASASKKHGDITMSELAAVHEYGSPKRGLPERSFLRSTITANASQYSAFLRPLLAQFLEGKLTIGRLLSLWGKQAAKDVRERLLKGAPLTPALSARTLEERKKRATQRQQSGTTPGKLRSADGKFLSLKNVGVRPLVDTGQLAASLTWEVVMSAPEEPSR